MLKTLKVGGRLRVVVEVTADDIASGVRHDLPAVPGGEGGGPGGRPNPGGSITVDAGRDIRVMAWGPVGAVRCYEADLPDEAAGFMGVFDVDGPGAVGPFTFTAELRRTV